MNALRRKTLREAVRHLESILGEDVDIDRTAVLSQIEEARSIVEVCMDEENMCLDCMPESLQNSERYETMSENCDQLSDTEANLEELIDDMAGCEDLDSTYISDRINDIISEIEDVIAK